MQRLLEFINSDWDEAYAYTTRDIADLLSCDTKQARYYLLRLVQRGQLGQLKYWGKTWYVKRHQLEMFRQFEFVRIR